MFTIADDDQGDLDVSAVIVTSLLMLGVPEPRATALAERSAHA